MTGTILLFVKYVTLLSEFSKHFVDIIVENVSQASAISALLEVKINELVLGAFFFHLTIEKCKT